MGTSKSGTGPASGVPLVPPWVPDPVPPTDGDGGDDADGQDQQAQPVQPAPAPQPAPIAPAARFGPARTSLGSFARTGSSDDMRRGLGHYVRKGYDGAGTAALLRSCHRSIPFIGGLFKGLELNRAPVL